VKTLLLGDSLLAWHDWSALLGQHLNHALPGESTDGLLYRLNRSLSASPECVVLLIGTNDLLQHTPLEHLEENYVELLSALLDIPRLIVVAVPPVASGAHTAGVNAAIITFNGWLREQGWKYGFTYADLHRALAAGEGLDPAYTTDGIHFNDAGYERFERLLREALAEAADA